MVETSLERLQKGREIKRGRLKVQNCLRFIVREHCRERYQLPSHKSVQKCSPGQLSPGRQGTTKSETGGAVRHGLLGNVNGSRATLNVWSAALSEAKNESDRLVCANVYGLCWSTKLLASMECAAPSSYLVMQSRKTFQGYRFRERRVRPVCAIS